MEQAEVSPTIVMLINNCVCAGCLSQIYSGAPLIWTPLGPSASGRIIEVSSSQELLIEHGCGLSLKLERSVHMHYHIDGRISGVSVRRVPLYIRIWISQA